jgi:hypothetical protein
VISAGAKISRDQATPLLSLFSRTTCADPRLRKDCDRSDNENNGEDGAAVAINLFGPVCLLIVVISRSK